MTQSDETEHSASDDLPEDRPLPGDKTYPADEHPQPGDGASGRAAATQDTSTSDDSGAKDDGAKDDGAKSDESSGDESSDDESGDLADSPDAEPVYNDRSKLDFDPDEGFYTGTAVTGDTEIPGEHERVDDVPIPDEESDDKDSDGDEKDGDTDDEA